MCILINNAISNLNGEEFVVKFHEKELQKTNQKEFRIRKLIKRKDNKQCVQWKGYNNLFDNWIDKKGHNINDLIASKNKIFRCKYKI